MLFMLRVITVILVAVTMGLALAHALELRGKLRLDGQTYLTVQTIYYPGFTIGGIGEPLSIGATLALLVMTSRHAASFWWVLASFLALVAMQVVFWWITQPSNRYWLRNQRLSPVGTRFFSLDRTAQPQERGSGSHDWKYFRNRWEYSHVLRAILGGIALLAVVVAIAM